MKGSIDFRMMYKANKNEEHVKHKYKSSYKLRLKPLHPHCALSLFMKLMMQSF